MDNYEKTNCNPNAFPKLINELYDDTNVVLGKCIDIATEVNRINKCLLQNNLYHND